MNFWALHITIVPRYYAPPSEYKTLRAYLLNRINTPLLGCLNGLVDEQTLSQCFVLLLVFAIFGNYEI